MYYHWFTAALKNLLVTSISEVFTSHPFYKKVVVTGSYPYEERPTFGVVVRNNGGDPQKLSADNFLGHLESHVFLAKIGNFPGTSIEWVAEDILNMSELVTENVTSQVTGGKVTFKVPDTIVGSVRNVRRGYGRDLSNLLNKGDLRVATSTTSVWARVNSVAAYVARVDGAAKEVELLAPPKLGDIVNIQYLKRTLAPAGLYYFDFVSENQFFVDSLGIVEDEIVLNDDETVPATPALSLEKDNIQPGTVYIKKYFNQGSGQENLYEPRDFSVVPATGELTFVVPPVTGDRLVATYKYQSDSFGPFDVEPNVRRNDIIPGVVVAFGRGIQAGDKMVVGVLDERKNISNIYGGKWNFSFSLDVHARDPIQREEIIDYLMVNVWQILRPRWAASGIVLDNISLGSESEDVIDELSNDVQYLQDISLDIMSDWEVHVPFPAFVSEIDLTFGGHFPSNPEEVKVLEEPGLVAVRVLPEAMDHTNDTERVF